MISKNFVVKIGSEEAIFDKDRVTVLESTEVIDTYAKLVTRLVRYEMDIRVVEF
jgi:hypothetical protein